MEDGLQDHDTRGLKVGAHPWDIDDRLSVNTQR